MLNIAICDDEPVIASEVETLLLNLSQKTATELVTDIFSDGVTLMESYAAGRRYDIIYLDIQMQTVDGLATAKKIRSLDSSVLIVYISGFSKFMESAFEVDAFDFICKPLQKERFEKCFLRAVNRVVSSQTAYYEYHYKNEWIKIALKDILYFESVGRKICIHLSNGQMESFNEKLDMIEQQLSNSKLPFLRTHKSYFVNYHYIRALSRTQIRLLTDAILPVSREKYSDISKKFGKLLGGEISD